MLRFLLVFLLVFPVLDAQVIQKQTLYTTAKVEGGVTVTVDGQTFGPYQGVEGVPAFSADLQHWALVARKTGPGNAHEVLVDGKSATTLDQYNGLMGLSLTEDGKTWSLVAGLSTNSRQNAVRITNGVASPPLGNVGPLVGSPDGKSSYFVAESDKGRVVVLNGKVLGPFQDVRFAAWDLGGSKLAFSFSRGGSWFLWTDGKEAGPFQDAQPITRADGAWLGTSTTDKANKTTLNIGGKAYGPYDSVAPNLDWKSADGTKWMTRAYKKGVAYLVDNGKETKLDSLDFQTLPGGSWVARYGGFANWRLNIDGQVLGPYDAPSTPLAFADGSNWAFSYGTLPNDPTEKYFIRLKNGKTYPGAHLKLIADDQGQAFTWYTDDRQGPLVFSRVDKSGYQSTTLVTVVPSPPDGITLQAEKVTSGPYAEVTGWAASPDGRHWGALVRLSGDRYQVVVDGREGAPTGALTHVGDLQISGNGASWSLRGWPTKGSDSQVRIVNGVMAGPFQSPWPVMFSADGSHSGYWSQSLKGNQKQLNFDGKQYGPYAKDQLQHLYDLDAGHFAFGMPDKGGTLVVTDQGNFGPFQDYRILPKRELVRDSETGSLFGFTARKSDGSTVLYVFPGVPGGGVTYGPFQNLNGNGQGAVTQGDWYFLGQKSGSPSQTLLHNGEATEVRGADVRVLASGGVQLRVWEENQETLTLNGRSLGSWTHVNQWLVADDQNWAAEVQQGEGPQSRNLLVINGQELTGTDLKLIGSPGRQSFQWFSVTPEGSGVRNTLALP
ncbi:MAG: hypothetical protein WCG80_09785 [Spirochaetales bacterium]